MVPPVVAPLSNLPGWWHEAEDAVRSLWPLTGASVAAYTGHMCRLGARLAGGVLIVRVGSGLQQLPPSLAVRRMILVPVDAVFFTVMLYQIKRVVATVLWRPHQLSPMQKGPRPVEPARGPLRKQVSGLDPRPLVLL